ncbi:hypothetical protein [Massilia violaceinigra]|nr:hypothetical protein [Massilia violaceinigra]
MRQYGWKLLLGAALMASAPGAGATSPCLNKDGCIDAWSAFVLVYTEMGYEYCLPVPLSDQDREKAIREKIGDVPPGFLERLRASAVYAATRAELEDGGKLHDPATRPAFCKEFYLAGS